MLWSRSDHLPYSGTDDLVVRIVVTDTQLTPVLHNYTVEVVDMTKEKKGVLTVVPTEKPVETPTRQGVETKTEDVDTMFEVDTRTRGNVNREKVEKLLKDARQWLDKNSQEGNPKMSYKSICSRLGGVFYANAHLFCWEFSQKNPRGRFSDLSKKYGVIPRRKHGLEDMNTTNKDKIPEVVFTYMDTVKEKEKQE